MLIISRLYSVYITTLIVRHHKCQYLVAFMYVRDVYKHRLRFMWSETISPCSCIALFQLTGYDNMYGKRMMLW